MKRKFLLIAAAALLLACSKDDNKRDNNPNLLNPLVNLNLNLNLPQYNPLKFPGNSIILQGQGIKGIVIYNINNSEYSALDLSDPNHPPSDCSRMTIEGIIAKCPCETDDNEYFITDGSPSKNKNQYPMQRYFTQRTGENLRISN